MIDLSANPHWEPLGTAGPRRPPATVQLSRTLAPHPLLPTWSVLVELYLVQMGVVLGPDGCWWSCTWPRNRSSESQPAHRDLKNASDSFFCFRSSLSLFLSHSFSKMVSTRSMAREMLAQKQVMTRSRTRQLAMSRQTRRQATRNVARTRRPAIRSVARNPTSMSTPTRRPSIRSVPMAPNKKKPARSLRRDANHKLFIRAKWNLQMEPVLNLSLARQTLQSMLPELSSDSFMKSRWAAITARVRSFLDNTIRRVHATPLYPCDTCDPRIPVVQAWFP